MTAIGDFEDADAYDVAPADPEQVARRLHAYRLDRDLEDVPFDDVNPIVRLVLVAIAGRLLDWLRREGAA